MSLVVKVLYGSACAAMTFCLRTQYAPELPGSSEGIISMTVYRRVPWMAWGTQISVDAVAF